MYIKIKTNKYSINKENVWKLKAIIQEDLYKSLMKLTNNTVNDLFFDTLFINSKGIYFYYTFSNTEISSSLYILCSTYSNEFNDLIRIDLEETFYRFSIDTIEEAIEKTYAYQSIKNIK